MEQGTPPGYAIFASPLVAEQEKQQYPDYAIYRDMPEGLRVELRAYYAAALAGRTPWRDDPKNPQPCLWFDAEMRRCRHYEHRPDICREFEIGSKECLAWRQRYNAE